MEIEYINKDISHIDRIPQIVQQKQSFYKLIKNICLYVDKSTKQIYDILENIRNINDISINSSNKLYLERLLSKCGINLKWLPTIVDDDVLINTYKLALQGISLLRTMDATPEKLKNMLQILYPTGNIVIEDSTLSNLENMTYEVTIDNISQDINASYINNYIKPYITGVSGSFTFNFTGFFTSMQYDITQHKELQTTNGNGALMWMKYNVNTHKEELDTAQAVKANNTGIWAMEFK